MAFDRKPEKGCEIQNVSCGKSGITLRMELVTTAEEEKQKLYEGGYKQETAVISRLVMQWTGRARVVCVDSYSASVETANTLNLMVVKFTGII